MAEEFCYLYKKKVRKHIVRDYYDLRVPAKGLFPNGS